MDPDTLARASEGAADPEGAVQEVLRRAVEPLAANPATAELPAEQYQDTVLITAENVASEDVTRFYGPDARSIG